MKRITRFRKKTWVLLGVVAVIAAMASVGAYAYFTTTGSGTGTATVGTSSNMTLPGTAGTTLYPGTSSSVSFTALNSSPGHQLLGTIYLASVVAYPTATESRPTTRMPSSDAARSIRATSGTQWRVTSTWPTSSPIRTSAICRKPAGRHGNRNAPHERPERLSGRLQGRVPEAQPRNRIAHRRRSVSTR